jgi:hypothetical protein
MITQQVLHKPTCAVRTRVKAAATTSTTPPEMCCRSSPKRAFRNVVQQPGDPQRTRNNQSVMLVTVESIAAGSAEVLGQDLAEAAGPVGDGAVADLAARDRKRGPPSWEWPGRHLTARAVAAGPGWASCPALERPGRRRAGPVSAVGARR